MATVSIAKYLPQRLNNLTKTFFYKNNERFVLILFESNLLITKLNGK